MNNIHNETRIPTSVSHSLYTTHQNIYNMNPNLACQNLTHTANIGDSNIVRSKPQMRNIWKVKNLKKNLCNIFPKIGWSAFNLVNNSAKTQDAVIAFKKLSISCAESNSPSSSLKSINWGGSIPEYWHSAANYSIPQKLSQKRSVDSTRSIMSTITVSNIELPDGAEATDIGGIRAFDDSIEIFEKSRKFVYSNLESKAGSSILLRKDVVLKGFLRSMKKYYTSKFMNYFNYSNKKFIRNSNSRLIILEKAEQFMAENFSSGENKEMGYFLLALIDSKHRFLIDRNEYSELSSKITGLLRSFTSKKLKDIWKFHQFGQLILNYLNQSEKIETLISQSQGDEEGRAVYKRYIYSLRRLVYNLMNQ